MAYEIFFFKEMLKHLFFFTSVFAKKKIGRK